jgi:hypothetical protein
MPISDWNLEGSEELGMLRALEEKAQINIFRCLVYGSEVPLSTDHPANNRAHDGIVYRASCESCYIPQGKQKGRKS